MGHYVYQYLHPEYGHLYCGRTENLDKRIYEHNNSKNDNISRKYERVLKNSIVMYIELKNKAQEIAVEAYCIDKYKPYLNKMLKDNNDDNEDCMQLTMSLPEWKIYDKEKSKYKIQLQNQNNEKILLENKINELKNVINNKKDILECMKTNLNEIEYEILLREKSDDINQFGFDFSDIKWFYKNCKNKNVKFYSELYDKTGKKCICGTVYLDEKNKVTLETYTKNRTSDDVCITTEGMLFLDTFGAALWDSFYPDKDIYVEFKACVLSKLNNLKKANAEYELNDLTDKYAGNVLLHSVDNNVLVEFKNWNIVRCRCDNIDKTSELYNHIKKYCDDGCYCWDSEYGTETVVDRIVEWVDGEINSEIEKYVRTLKYHTPDRDEKEEKVCRCLLSKFDNMEDD